MVWIHGGGHLASLAATSVGIKELEDLTMGNAEFPSEALGCYNQYRPINFLEMDQFFIRDGKEDFHRQLQPPVVFFSSNTATN